MSEALRPVPGIHPRGSIVLAALLAIPVVAACDESATEPPRSDAVIRLATSGGFAGVDFAVSVDGPAGVVRGERCVSFCDWSDGEVLATVAPARIQELELVFDASDFLEGDDEDFGDQCCDQFHYELGFARRGESRTVRGSSEVLPASVLALVLEVEEWVAEVRADDGAGADRDTGRSR